MLRKVLINIIHFINLSNPPSHSSIFLFIQSLGPCDLIMHCHLPCLKPCFLGWLPFSDRKDLKVPHFLKYPQAIGLLQSLSYFGPKSQVPKPSNFWLNYFILFLVKVPLFRIINLAEACLLPVMFYLLVFLTVMFPLTPYYHPDKISFTPNFLWEYLVHDFKMHLKLSSFVLYKSISSTISRGYL
jgi:hypothetical protein